MRTKLVCLFLSLCLLVAGCKNNGLDEYLKNSNNIEYGEIDEFKDTNIDAKIKQSKLEEKLRVGFFVPLTGSTKIVGESLLNAAKLSIFENKKHDIFLKVYDTKGTDFGAVEAMKKAISEGVDVILGPLFFYETKAISKMAKENNVILFSFSNEQKLQNVDNVYLTGSIIEQEIEILLNTLISEGKINFIAYLPNNSHGSTINNILRNKLKSKNAFLIKSDFYSQKDPNFEKKLMGLLRSYRVSDEFLEDYEKRKADSILTGEKVEYVINEENKIYPDVIFVAEGKKIAENVGMTMYKYSSSIRNIQILCTSKIDGAKNIEKNPYLQNIVFIGANPEKYEQYEKSYLTMFGVQPIKISSMVYDLVNNIDRFYKKEKGAYVVDRKKLLDPFGFDGIDGKARFLPNSLIERNFYVLKIEEGEKKIIEGEQDFLNY